MEEPQQLLLTVNEARALLSVSRGTFYRMMADGQIPVVRVRGLVRISMASLREFSETGVTAWHEGLA